jgi:hypothetical protein
MRPLLRAVAVLLWAGAQIAWAEKIPNDFRSAFDGAFIPKLTYLVALRDDIPTTSVYGIKGDQTSAYYSIDIVDGQWKTSEGIMDFNQAAVDHLRRGEILELVDVTYKDNRVDLRAVSVENHKVTRGNWLVKDRKPEPVSTNFKFFLPYPKSRVLTAADVPAVRRYVEQYVRPFRGMDAARAYAARVESGTADRERPAPGRSERVASHSGSSAGGRQEIKAGMTSLEVIELLGKPQKEVAFEGTSRWAYADLTVIFVNGRVKEVRF